METLQILYRWVELDKRWEIEFPHKYPLNEIDKSMSIDKTRHSLFGALKVVADVLAQEYVRHSNIKIGVFFGRHLTGPAYSATKL